MSCYLVQCLCPARHAIMALGVEGRENVEAAERGLLAMVDQAIAHTVINGWCELCSAPREQWRVEAREIPGKNLAEALPELRKCEAENMRTQQLVRAARRAASN